MQPGSPSKRDRTRSTLLVAVQQALLESSPTSLSVPRVIALAAVSQGTFYNYFDSLETAVDAVGGLLVAEHSRLVDQVTEGVEDPAIIFANSTRLTLNLATSAEGYGRLLFDSGLPVDRFLGGLRTRLGLDVATGLQTGRFHVDDPGVVLSITSGGILGVALDLYRERLPISAVEPATERLLRDLGLSARAARRVAHRPLALPPAAPLPLEAATLVAAGWAP